jgi:hypothetical protein
MIGDRAEPFGFDDAEIVATLATYGSGDEAEIRTAIALLEEETSGSMVSISRKQGSWSQTKTVMAQNKSRIEALKMRLAGLSGSSMIASGEMEMPTPEGLPFPPGRIW